MTTHDIEQVEQVAPPAPRRRRQRAPSRWTPELVAMLGKISDAELAQQLGVRRETVCERRRAAGIKPAAPRATANDLELAAAPALWEVEARHIAHVIKLAGGNKARAARVLGIDRWELYRRLQRIEKRAARAVAIRATIGQGK